MRPNWESGRYSIDYFRLAPGIVGIVEWRNGGYGGQFQETDCGHFPDLEDAQAAVESYALSVLERAYLKLTGVDILQTRKLLKAAEEDIERDTRKLEAVMKTATAEQREAYLTTQ